MTTRSRPTASNAARIAVMEYQVRDLFNCQPSMGTHERDDLLDSLVELDRRLEQLSLQAAAAVPGFSGDVSTCSVELLESEFAELKRQWMSQQPEPPPQLAN